MIGRAPGGEVTGLALQRNVPDLKALPQDIHRLSQEFILVHAVIVTNQMNCERIVRCAHGPDVQIVDGSDARQIQQGLTNRVQIDVIGNPVQLQMQ